MKAQITILVGTALICGALIAAQALRKRELDQRLAVLRGQVSAESATPEAASVRANLPAAADPDPSAPGAAEPPTPGPAESALALEKAVKDLNAMVAGVVDIQSSTGAFFGILPEVLKIIGDLDVDGVVALADQINPGGVSFPPRDAKGAAVLMLYLIAAEQEPLKILERRDLKLESPLGGLQESIFATLASRDPDAAIRWLDAQEMDDGRKTNYRRNIGFGLLARDPRRGLDYLLEHPDSLPQSGMGPMVAGIQFPEEARAGLIEALPDSRYAEIRPAISQILLGASAATVGIDELREQTGSLKLADRDVATFLRNNAATLVQGDPANAAAWMKETMPADQYSQTMATAIRQWTQRDFNAAATFLGEMDHGPARDQSIRAFAETVVWMEPDSAATWAGEIEDAATRQAAFKEVGRVWSLKDRDAARQWMERQGIKAPDTGAPKAESP